MSILSPKKPLIEKPGLAGLDQRSREIFRNIVETYIASGEPVGSRTISRSLGAHLSPASIRNVMMDLEDSGLIYAPHTSAGRLPTEAGLRFFVDALLEINGLDEQERARIDAEVKASNRQRRTEDVLDEASAMLSGLSQCASLVMSPKYNARLKHIEFVNLAPGRALLILVSEDGGVENRIIDVPAGVPASTFIRATNYLSSLAQGRTMDELRRHVASEVESLRRELDDVSARLVESGLAVWSGADAASAKNLIVRGQAKLLEGQGPAADLERVRKLFDDIENKKDLVEILGLAEKAEGVRIFIGSENRLFSMSGSSLIVAPFKNRDEKIVGVLGIIGPTRLNYARIIPMVDYTAKMVGDLLS
ncbi:MAG: heat-inducible transcriptional repressor HrcA [Alphaproteobacteria bacterium]|nr:heat-inducible transcriptional repressor HrcA [Alphaproteobacteria bacterium]